MNFQSDIRPMFRDKDRNKMMFAFDLWDYHQVSRYADEIFARIEAGSMPCDGTWPPERIETFRAWIAEGMSR